MEGSPSTRGSGREAARAYGRLAVRRYLIVTVACVLATYVSSWAGVAVVLLTLPWSLLLAYTYAHLGDEPLGTPMLLFFVAFAALNVPLVHAAAYLWRRWDEIGED